MKLSDKLKQLQQDIFNDEYSPSDIEDGWNRCIEDSEFMEEKIKRLDDRAKKLDKAVRDWNKLKRI